MRALHAGKWSCWPSLMSPHRKSRTFLRPSTFTAAWNVVLGCIGPAVGTTVWMLCSAYGRHAGCQGDGWGADCEPVSVEDGVDGSRNGTAVQRGLPIGFAAVPNAANLDGIRFGIHKKHAVVANAQSQFFSALQGFHVARARFRKAVQCGKNLHGGGSAEAADIALGLRGPDDPLHFDSSNLYGRI